MEAERPSSEDTGNVPQIPLVLTAVFLIYLAQMTLNPIIAPLSREVGLAEWQVGVTISTAALMLVTTSQLWGRRSQSWGRKPVLIAALGLGSVTMVAFALVYWLGMTGVIAGGMLFALFVILRGFGFGAAIAAIPRLPRRTSPMSPPTKPLESGGWPESARFRGSQ